MKKINVAVLMIVLLPAAMPAFAATPDAPLFKSKCAMCHGSDGAGNTPIGKSQKIPDLRSDAVQKETDIELTKVIAGGKGKMPGFGKQLSTEQVEALIAHIRTLRK